MHRQFKRKHIQKEQYTEMDFLKDLAQEVLKGTTTTVDVEDILYSRYKSDVEAEKAIKKFYRVLHNMEEGVSTKVRHRRLQEKEDVDIDVKNPGVLEVPEGKSVDSLPVSHFVNLAKKKGTSDVTKALNNLQVWNKNKDPKLSKWTGDMIDKVNKKMEKNESTWGKKLDYSGNIYRGGEKVGKYSYNAGSATYSIYWDDPNLHDNRWLDEKEVLDIIRKNGCRTSSNNLTDESFTINENWISNTCPVYSVEHYKLIQNFIEELIDEDYLVATSIRTEQWNDHFERDRKQKQRTKQYHPEWFEEIEPIGVIEFYCRDYNNPAIKKIVSYAIGLKDKLKKESTNEATSKRGRKQSTGSSNSVGGFLDRQVASGKIDEKQITVVYDKNNNIMWLGKAGYYPIYLDREPFKSARKVKNEIRINERGVSESTSMKESPMDYLDSEKRAIIDKLESLGYRGTKPIKFGGSILIMYSKTYWTDKRTSSGLEIYIDPLEGDVTVQEFEHEVDTEDLTDLCPVKYVTSANDVLKIDRWANGIKKARYSMR